MSQRDQHLTTEQLSSLLDKQLSPEEQAACSAHLVDCEQCQDALDYLQLTVNLLRSLPQLEVPRSFALPSDFKIASDADLYDGSDLIGYQAETQGYENARAAIKKKTSHKLSTPLRRTLRTVSALAAVVGIFLALSGFIVSLSQLHMSGGSSASTGSVPAFSNVNRPTTPAANGSQSKEHSASTNEGGGNTTNTSGTSSQSTTTPHLSSNPDSTNKQPTSPTVTTSSIATWLPLIDFNLPGTRLSIGILLAILGGMGYRLFTRQQK